MAQKNYVSLSKLSTFLDNLKNTFAPQTHGHIIGDMTDLQTTLDGKAASTHTHSVTDITSGAFGVNRGGTGRTTLDSGSYLIGNGTGAVSMFTKSQVLTDIGAAASSHTHSEYAASSHAHSAADITSGTLGTARGGTGLTSSPSMLTNLGSTTAANVLQASPRPGVTGTLPIANGGTGATAKTTALTNLGTVCVGYGTCATAAATAAKVISMSGNTNWDLVTGSIIMIKFTYTNTASSPTFNVNSKGAKSVYYNGSQITTTSNILNKAGYASRVGIYVYDGTGFVFLGWSYETGNGLTTNKALISNANGQVTTSAVTSTELGYLDGVTSNIQTQLNGKISYTMGNSVGFMNGGSYKSIAYGNGRYVALSNNSTNLGEYSDNGIDWNLMVLPTSTHWTSVTYGNDKFVAVSGASGSTSNVFAYSEDGINWTSGTLPSSKWWTSITYGNGKFVAVSSGNVAAYSTNGTSWTSATLPSSQQWMSVMYSSSQFVAVSVSAYTAYSSTGSSWTSASISSNAWYSVTATSNYGYVTVAKDSAYAAFSSGGTSWTTKSLPVSSAWCSVTANDDANSDYCDTCVAVSEDGDVAYSTDGGKTWAAATTPITSTWYNVTYANGLFIASGSSNTFMYSADGINWYYQKLKIQDSSGTDITNLFKLNFR